jgi:hypothetical protein
MIKILSKQLGWKLLLNIQDAKALIMKHAEWCIKHMLKVPPFFRNPLETGKTSIMILVNQKIQFNKFFGLFDEPHQCS